MASSGMYYINGLVSDSADKYIYFVLGSAICEWCFVKLVTIMITQIRVLMLSRTATSRVWKNDQQQQSLSVQI